MKLHESHETNIDHIGNKRIAASIVAAWCGVQRTVRRLARYSVVEITQLFGRFYRQKYYAG